VAGDAEERTARLGGSSETTSETPDACGRAKFAVCLAQGRVRKVAQTRENRGRGRRRGG
jgi:hypothetical protein